MGQGDRLGDSVSGSGCQSPSDVQTQLQKILNSPEFAGADRLRQFLEFIVKRTLEGQGDGLKEVVIGVELLKKPHFNPKFDGSVRITASRVRAKLDEYYTGRGKNDTLHIGLPVGHYVPEFVLIAKPPQQHRRELAAMGGHPRGRIAIGLGIALLTAGLGALFWHMLSRSTANERRQTRWGRLLAKATSEGRYPKSIHLGYGADWVAASPDESTVFASTWWSPRVTVISTRDDSVKTLVLPQDAGPLTVSPDGRRLYVGSRIGGIMVAEPPFASATSRVLPTPGPVWDLAVTPDGSKVFVASGYQGVWRFRTRDRASSRLTTEGCPEQLSMDPDGRILVVNYQCGGPGGSSGHDAIEFIDTVTEKRMGTINGLAFVGGPASYSPDGSSLIVSGLDACTDPQYDHVNCPAVPSHVFHIIHMPDRRLIEPLGLPVETGRATFIDSARVLVMGRGLRVQDAFLSSMLERWSPSEPGDGQTVYDFEAIALLAKRRRAYVNDRNHKTIRIFDAESDDCSPPLRGLVAHYTGDGVLSNVAGGSALLELGKVAFGSGRIGQAFSFDGASSHLVEQKWGHYQFGYRDSSIVLYAKFTSLQGAITILERGSTNGGPSARLLKAADDRLTFEFTALGQPPQILNSTTRVLANRWYHIAAVKTDGGLTLYVDGVPESRSNSGIGRISEWFPFHIGSDSKGKSILHGKLDEIMFYDRALTDREVQELYRRRETGACKI